MPANAFNALTQADAKVAIVCLVVRQGISSPSDAQTQLTGRGGSGKMSRFRSPGSVLCLDDFCGAIF